MTAPSRSCRAAISTISRLTDGDADCASTQGRRAHRPRRRSRRKIRSRNMVDINGKNEVVVTLQENNHIAVVDLAVGQGHRRISPPAPSTSTGSTPRRTASSPSPARRNDVPASPTRCSGSTTTASSPPMKATRRRQPRLHDLQQGRHGRLRVGRLVRVRNRPSRPLSRKPQQEGQTSRKAPRSRPSARIA